MVSRYLAALSVLLLVQIAPSRAQDQSFAAFAGALWKDAQAKGITRATFDTALKGVTPDQRVIAATKRQPEYGKPVGDYVNAIVSNRRIADAQLKAREWSKTFDAVEKKFEVERWVLARSLGNGIRFRRRKRSLGCVPLARDTWLREISRSLFPHRIARGDANHAGQPASAREDGELLGRRHGADPIHAVELRRLCHRFLRGRARRYLEPTCRTCLHRRRIISANGNGMPRCPGASK